MISLFYMRWANLIVVKLQFLKRGYLPHSCSKSDGEESQRWGAKNCHSGCARVIIGHCECTLGDHDICVRAPILARYCQSFNCGLCACLVSWLGFFTGEVHGYIHHEAEHIYLCLSLRNCWLCKVHDSNRRIAKIDIPLISPDRSYSVTQPAQSQGTVQGHWAFALFQHRVGKVQDSIALILLLLRLTIAWRSCRVSINCAGCVKCNQNHHSRQISDPLGLRYCQKLALKQCLTSARIQL